MLFSLPRVVATKRNEEKRKEEKRRKQQQEEVFFSKKSAARVKKAPKKSFTEIPSFLSTLETNDTTNHTTARKKKSREHIMRCV